MSRFAPVLLLLTAVPAFAADEPAPPPPAPPPPYGAPITLDAAKKVIAAAEAEARKAGLTNQVITVLDSGGYVIATERMDNAPIVAIPFAEGKAKSAIQFKRASKGIPDDGLHLLPVGIMALPGGELLVSDGKIAGAIGVSGASPALDEQVASAGMAAMPK